MNLWFVSLCRERKREGEAPVSFGLRDLHIPWFPVAGSNFREKTEALLSVCGASCWLLPLLEAAVLWFQMCPWLSSK
jgi:hypothetical protein